jgi:hypothetical protein
LKLALAAGLGRRAAGGAALRGVREVIQIGLVVFLGASLARAVVAVGLGDALADSRPEWALKIGDRSPDTLSVAAEGRLRLKDHAGAATAAFAALDQSPLNVRALRADAMALEEEGRQAKAGALFRFAGARSWRDNTVQAWLLRDALNRGRYDEAFGHADALVRRRDAFQPAVFQLFAAAAGQTAPSDALAERLDQAPPWRGAFLSALARSSQTDAVVASLFQRIDRGPAPLLHDEVGDYLQRLALEGRYGAAFSALRGFKLGAGLAQTPFDGDFDGRPGVEPFTWRRVGRVGVSLDFAPAPERPGHALRVAYDGFSSTDLMQQSMSLTPGEHTLSGTVYGEAGDAGRLRWKVRCIADGRIVAAVAPTIPRSRVWTAFKTTFSAPTSGCDGVQLVLIGTPGDRRTSVIAWFGDLRIS